MLIKVTQDHINRGVRCRAGDCPINLSIMEQTGYEANTLGNDVVLYINKEDFVYVRLDNLARVFISHFDGGKPVSPIEFDLDVSSLPAAQQKLYPHREKPYKPSRFWHFLLRRRHG